MCRGQETKNKSILPSRAGALFLLLLCTAAIPGYDFSSPREKIVLPAALNEISGAVWISDSTLACIQDEHGVIFIYNLQEKQITRRFTFNMNGDYEGITRVGDDLFILRSDGILFEIVSFTSPSFRLNTYMTNIPAANNEGLCYDAANKRLLIAAKSNPVKGKEFRDKRVIYGFDLETKKLSHEPAYVFDTDEINEKLYGGKKKARSDGKWIKFRASALDIHPVTRKLYLLSAADHALFIFSLNGRLEHIEQLNPQMFNKAEGITFNGRGEVIITNEAQQLQPTLLLFSPGN